jgi:uncharacterized protein YidB (DUF937 family)
MKNTTDSTVEEDIGDITKQITVAWDERKTLRQIADETGLTTEVINRILKQILKNIVGKRVKPHEKEGYF